MPVLDAVQTFAGIANENEFYSHHYLAEVFKGDIKARLDAWEAAEAEHPGEEAHRAPHKRLQTWAQKWFGLRGQVQRSRDIHRVFDDYRRWVEDTLTTEPQPWIQVLAAVCNPSPAGA